MKTMLFVLLAALPLAAVDFSFQEKFAEPTSRDAALTELIPDTRDWFFYHALHQQLKGEQAAFQHTMDSWKAAATRKLKPIDDQGYQTLTNREILLRFNDDPEKSCEALIDALELDFEDTRPDAREVEKLADELDPALISADAFEKLASRLEKQPWKSYSADRLFSSLDQLDDFSEDQLRHALRTLTRADHPKVVPLVSRGFNLKPDVSFGDAPVHRMLTLAQLEALQTKHPKLNSEYDFVTTWLKKLRQHSDDDFTRDPALHAAHLARLWASAKQLTPALAELRMHVLFHHIRLQHQIGEVKLEDFLTYLKIPRRRHSLLIDDKENPTISLTRNYSDISGCRSIDDDAPLIRDLLTHFLAGTDTAKAFARLIEADELAKIHARARLLAGAETSRWGKLLEASEFAQLREETRVKFSNKRPILLDSDAKVALNLTLKNAPQLLVRIHELDLPSILARQGKEPNADMELSGLVPHHTRTLRYEQPPIVAHQENITLPELKGPGAWIVEFVAEGQACRALIRKGRLIPYLNRTAEGQSLRVFDENGRPVAKASLSLGSEEFIADKNGTILIPNGELAASGEALLSHGRLANTVEIGSRNDNLELEAKFHLDREQFRADTEARLRVSLNLTNHRQPLPLDLIENAKLTFSAVLASGITTEHVISEDLKLSPSFIVPFQVPADTVALNLKLAATIVPRDEADPVKLETTDRFKFNSLIKGLFTHAHFTVTPKGHHLELRGRNGEPLADRAISFAFRHQDFKHNSTVKIKLRTNQEGRIDLGKLKGITLVSASYDDQTLASLSGSQLTSKSYIPYGIRIATDESISLPLEAPLNRTRYSLIRHDLAGRPLSNHFENIAAGNGTLTIAKLPPGTYDFNTPSDNARIEVVDGMPTDGLFISPAKITPHLPAASPALISSGIQGNRIQLQLKNITPDTRVHLIGNRYQHSGGTYRSLRPPDPVVKKTFLPGYIACSYLTDRTLDEETRYILERRATKTYPGTMLPRAGLLANRWSEEDLSAGLLPPLGGEAGSESKRRSKGDSGGFGSDPFADGGGHSGTRRPDFIDYLARSSELRYDLKPDDQGRIELPLAAFDGCQLVQIVMTSADSLHHEILPLQENPIPLRDRRLARPLDPDKHHLGTQRAAALLEGAEASIENMLDADWRAFTTLAEAHEFLYGTTGSERLRELVGMLDWPDFDEESKLAFWSDHACHELHLFVSRRDPAFFEKHIKPMLEEKREPTFIDDYLLARDLTNYLRPFAWQRLNGAEKALLSQALPDARKRIASELEHRWELESPTPQQQAVLFTQTLRGTDLAIKDSLGIARAELGAPSSMVSAGATYVLQKLRNIIIPKIDFQDVSLEEAIDFLRIRSIELDSMELDPSKKGISFVVRKPRSDPSELGLGETEAITRIAELKLRNVPLTEALDYICEATRKRWSVDDFAVTIKPATEVEEDLFTRTFNVPPDFIARITGTSSGSGDIDPFAPTPDAGLLPRMSLVEALKANGVQFPADANAQYFASNSTLLVRTTPTNHDLIEQIVSAVGSSGGGGGGGSDPFSSAGFPVTPASPTSFFNEYDPPELPNATGRPLGYRGRSSWSSNRGQTRLWLESNYDHHRSTDSSESLIPVNAFWLDLAKWNGDGLFLSPHFNACTRSHNEALMCLALLDLPFSAERPKVRVDGGSLKVKATKPMLLFYKDTRETDQVAPDSPVLVRQTFHRLDDRFRTENGRRTENSITGEFRTGVAYGSSLVVTNPTGAGRRIEALAQIPAGAIALAGKEETLSETRELQPYGVLTFDLAFYFPEPGTFTSYPLQVAEGDVMLATAPKRVLEVTNDNPAEDKASWKVLARDGTDEEILARLSTANLHSLELQWIAWRMKDRAFYQKATGILGDRLILPQYLARYAFLHGDRSMMSTWLENSSYLDDLGNFLGSPLLELSPTEHLGWRSFEFDPLIIRRAHQLGSNQQLTQEEAFEHYRSFLDLLAWKPGLSADDQLHLTWFLFLQDRISEALARFPLIQADQLSTTLAYDYLQCLVHFHQAEPAKAATIATRRNKLPPGQWSERFAAVAEQAAEIAKMTENKEAPDESKKDGQAPQLDIELAQDGSLRLTHRKLKQASVSLYQIDLEMLFSRNPFLQDAGELPGTRPNLIRKVKLGGDATTVKLPDAFRRGNVLVAADGGQAKALQILDSRAIDVSCRRIDSVLQVRKAATGAPLSAAYVKVYIEKNGEPEFLKDGYTDLRGKFDYRSITDGTTAPKGRIAILVAHPELGSRTIALE